MPLKKQIDDDLITALKAKEEIRLSVVRMLKAAIKNKEIELIQQIGDDEVLRLISTLIKQRRDSVEQFKLGGRQDLVDRELKEITVLEKYLPQQFSADELVALVEAAVRETGAKGPKEMGQVMKALQPKLAGRADGKVVSELVKKKLTSL